MHFNEKRAILLRRGPPCVNASQARALGPRHGVHTTGLARAGGGSAHMHTVWRRREYPPRLHSSVHPMCQPMVHARPRLVQQRVARCNMRALSLLSTRSALPVCPWMHPRIPASLRLRASVAFGFEFALFIFDSVWIGFLGTCLII